MNYDIKEIYSEMQDRLDWLSGHEKFEWLISEVARLQEENERLLEENRTLREEVTLARLETTRVVPAEVVPIREEKDNLTEEARRFYRQLPESFTFIGFFDSADAGGLTGTEAKEYLRLFLKERMLLQTGTRIEKTKKLGPVSTPVRLPLTH